MKTLFLALALLGLTTSCKIRSTPVEFVSLFPEEGQPKGWIVRAWNDVKDAAPTEARWMVRDGILYGSEPRGTWLISEKEYGDFILEYEWKLPDRGNSGCGLRFPLHGDPAFDGLELQMVDPRYFPPNAPPKKEELSGALYRAVAPVDQLYKPGEWNHYQITCRGSKVKVVLNGRPIVDVDLDEENSQPQRHDGSYASPLKDRPRRGQIGFQELSRGGYVQIRHARIAELTAK